MTFGWGTGTSSSGQPVVSWAAFYSDCEHEVFEVASGHRITLTYNLYAVHGAGNLTGTCHSLDPKQLPFYEAIKAVVDSEPFGNKGGILGLWCTHSYPHRDSDQPLPETLKGADAVIWERLRSLGVEPQLKPQLNVGEALDSWGGYEVEYPGGISADMYAFGRTFNVHVDRFSDKRDMGEVLEALEDWGDVYKNKLHMLGRPKHRSLQLTYVAYGNEATIDTMYSNCAILVPFASKKA